MDSARGDDDEDEGRARGARRFTSFGSSAMSLASNTKGFFDDVVDVDGGDDDDKDLRVTCDDDGGNDSSSDVDS